MSSPKLYGKVFCVLSTWTSLLWKKVVFWIPLMKSESNLANECSGRGLLIIYDTDILFVINYLQGE
jgi:hypothetical protein